LFILLGGPQSCQEVYWENQYLHHLKKFHPHLVPPNYQTFSSFVGAPPEAAPQPSSVVYPPGQVQELQPAPQAFFEILEQWNQMKCVISDMKVGMSDLKIVSNETRLELVDHRGLLNDIMAEIGYWKKHKNNQGFCMQGTILAIVLLIIGLVFGSYITAGLSKKIE
jgi:hypothetical protein